MISFPMDGYAPASDISRRHGAPMALDERGGRIRLIEGERRAPGRLPDGHPRSDPFADARAEADDEGSDFVSELWRIPAP